MQGRRGRIGPTMNRSLLPSFALALALVHTAALARPAIDDALPAPVAAALAKAGLPPDALAAIAIPQTRWARTWQYRADMPMQPASTMKLVTSVVALDRLGPNLRGRTELLASGAIEGELLNGDLVLKGGADPELDLPTLWQMLFELHQRGVRVIGGDIVFDRSLFRPARLDIGVAPFDDSPEWPYNVIPDALMLSGNLMRVALSSADGTIRARLAPPLDGIELDASAMKLTDSRCEDWDDDWQPALVTETAPGRWRIVLQGGFPRRCDNAEALQLLDRNLINERQVRALWASLGGAWRKGLGNGREGIAPAGATRIALHESRPWGEVLRHMNKTSDNAETRLLFLQLGLAGMAGDTSTATIELSKREVERWFDEQRIERAGLVLDNGSGLSRSERIAPRTMARMLQTALKGKNAPDLLMSLPVAGVDGTMRRRLRGSAAEGWARLKTGTLRDVVALAGAVRDSKGDTWVVSAMVNHADAAKGVAVLDAWIEWIAKSGARWR